ncbi:thiol reductant ABC exporter subunit CydC [Pseudoxanthomonas sp. SE1]|uniref:thiol reductant ABC exporter subunit CydC n=1 Tax=Pseudoxanthomonas sp. SE1 TaxID=1664560 RepID=UPI00240E9351|nr:thiol reductant ABC exporter subunit CydC [Pseudoxanthomonas sp. SE1]WFC41635.1 thiol reductant ABC exporter subunit CydC [Pseudoxanthomonas sp. SE1]
MSTRHDTPPMRLRDVALRHRKRIVLAVALLLLTLLAGTALLGLSGHFLTAAALAGSTALGFNFFGPSAGIRALTFVRILSRYAEKLLGHDATLRLARDLRVWFFRRALPLAPLGLGRFRVGELMARLMADIDAIDGLLVRAIGPLLAVLSLCVLATSVALVVLPLAGTVLLVALALLAALVPWLAARSVAALESERAEARMHLRATVQEGIEGQQDLTAMDATAAWLAALDARSRDVARWEDRRKQRLALATLAHALVTALTLPAMLWVLLEAVHVERIGAAAAGGLFFMTVAVLEACAAIGPAWQAWRAAIVAAQRLQEVVDPPAAECDATVTRSPAGRGALELQDVAFAWAGTTRRVLDGASLHVAPGERVLVAGDSGEGKSSLLALVLGLRTPQQGRVSFAGDDLRTLDPALWHTRIAWLPQDAPVFSGSVRENLHLGDPDADDARLWQALAQVKLDARFRDAGDGLDTWVGENGATLSAGQARRLALARALLRDAPLLLLDEPTEGLDQDTADALMRDIATASEGRSVLIISHATLPEGVVDTRYRLRDGTLAKERDSRAESGGI